ncbi:uncharacterized protein KGF55_004267 [Candida pseudojiufengensis]|uniref:uncharacterized protein n=1 Tax=Candida pseudojiufengensis TaxID=497109 RepID=UPI002223F142|nr:uncharacterized protein KGF55_004267 [Candida pseudojiufengensis]KAI5961000.1 hypothetical protein KGF55_004267 [Candida pseudojiufengensis]
MLQNIYYNLHSINQTNNNDGGNNNLPSPTPTGPRLPNFIIKISLYSSLISAIIIFISIFLHLINYRKPFQQRLMIRIQIIVPLFALTCYSMLINQTSPFNKFILEPIREVYEAFVIYTFFSLLNDMLGGERNIIIMTSGREPVRHPGILGYILVPLDISDPKTFLMIKRGILQYVWLKPIICITIIIGELTGFYNVNDMSYKSIYLWLTLIYNASVTLSLYSLAIFWKILWNDLKPFKPVGKFLCVKLIIFASYWQGVILAILNFFEILPGSNENKSGESIGICIQNALLCVELIAFAIGHWLSFSYIPFTISNLPWGRYKFKYALKDWIGFKDLIIDFQKTFKGDHYKDYRQFDSVEALVAHPDSKGRMSRIHQGLRYHYDGKHKHWLPDNSSINASQNIIPSTSEVHALDNASILSNNTSMRGLYPQSPKSTPPGSPITIREEDEISDSEYLIDVTTTIPNTDSIQNIINSDQQLSKIDYSKENFDLDEKIYQDSLNNIKIYSLNEPQIKKILNYPIVDETLESHLYGYKVQQLRRQRQQQQQQRSRKSLNNKSLNKNNNNGNKRRDSDLLSSNQSYRYGSIV